MELKTVCNNCIGIDKCNKLCELHMGYGLLSFIKGIDFIETAIGEFREDYKSKKIEYIVSGHMLENVGNPTYILSDLTTSIDASGKFTSCDGKSPQQILRAYLDSIGIDNKVKESALDTFRKLNGNKLIPFPLKPGAECEITYKDNNGKTNNTSCKIQIIRWMTDRATGKIKCEVICAVDKNVAFETNSKMVSIPLTEYGHNIRLPQLERTLKSSEMDRDILQMTDIGFIRPIEVSDEKFVVALDSCFLYRVVDKRVFIIGAWRGNKLEDYNKGMDQVSKSKAYKKIANALSYIERHRRFIAPYGLYECNKIDVT